MSKEVLILGNTSIGHFLVGVLAQNNVSVSIIADAPQESSSKTFRDVAGNDFSFTTTIAYKTKDEINTDDYEHVFVCESSQNLFHSLMKNFDLLEDKKLIAVQDGVQGENLLSGNFDRELIYSFFINGFITQIDESTYAVDYTNSYLDRPFVLFDQAIHQIAALFPDNFQVNVQQNVLAQKRFDLILHLPEIYAYHSGQSFQKFCHVVENQPKIAAMIKEGMGIFQSAKVEMTGFAGADFEQFLALLDTENDAKLVDFLTSRIRDKEYVSFLGKQKNRDVNFETEFFHGEVTCTASQIQQTAVISDEVLTEIRNVTLK